MEKRVQVTKYSLRLPISCSYAGIICSSASTPRAGRVIGDLLGCEQVFQGHAMGRD